MYRSLISLFFFLWMSSKALSSFWSVMPIKKYCTSTKNFLIPSQRSFLRTGQCCSSCIHFFRAASNSISHLVWNFQTCTGKYRTSALTFIPHLMCFIWATEYPFISRKPWPGGKKSHSFNSTLTRFDWERPLQIPAPVSTSSPAAVLVFSDSQGSS